MADRRDPRREAEATQFAMELLIPAHFLERDLAGVGLDVESEPRIAQLARRYQVSEQLMTARLAQLGYLGRCP